MSLENIPFLIETALLTHGLKSITEEELLSIFPKDTPYLTWIDHGDIVVDSIEKFLPIRRLCNEISRVDIGKFSEACRGNACCALTASATMAAADRLGIKLVVTSGMGGLLPLGENRESYDLAALRDMNVTLLAAAPKDIFDIKKTTHWLREHHIPVYGYSSTTLDGFIFRNEENVMLDGVFDGTLEGKGKLILNPIPVEERLRDKSVLSDALDSIKDNTTAGESFHPSLNRALDQISGGCSGRLQLSALINNIEIAKRIILY